MIIFFFFNDTATTEIYTLSLHDALPIFLLNVFVNGIALLIPFLDCSTLVYRNTIDFCVLIMDPATLLNLLLLVTFLWIDRKSTRLNSSHANISYAVFCLKKKKYIDRCYV